MNKKTGVRSMIHNNKLIIAGLVVVMILTMSFAAAAKTAKSITFIWKWERVEPFYGLF